MSTFHQDHRLIVNQRHQNFYLNNKMHHLSMTKREEAQPLDKNINKEDF